ncbi:hypothetical protein BJY04DRAFT_142427 [Aspergillus karnatakaensis]|uniref:uncharacterized protein n=1 Tax=Aspergillus karnatakaensis TaxID=1810916 RepID=UPI003CCCC282
MILDRCIALETGKPSSISTTQEHNPAYTESESGLEPPATPEDTQLSLNHLHSASIHLSFVLDHIRKPSYDEKSGEAMDIIESLTVFRESLGVNKMSLLYPAAAVCTTAVMAFLEHGLRLDHQPGRDCSPLCFGLLEAEVEQVVQAAKRLKEEISEDEDLEIPIFTLHAIGRAAVLILRYFQESGVIDVGKAIGCLRGLLERMKGRWLGAGMLFLYIRI